MYVPVSVISVFFIKYSKEVPCLRVPCSWLLCATSANDLITTVPTDSLLITIDIDSLYTNIETTEGMKAVKDCMLRFPYPKRPDKYILKLLEINLTKNDFEFDSNFIYR